MAMASSSIPTTLAIVWGRDAALDRRQLGDERSRGDGTYARHGDEKLLGLPPHRRSAHAGVDIGVDVGELLFEKGDVAVDFLDETLIARAPAAILLHADHLDDLASSGDEFAKPLRLRRGD